MSMLTSLLGSFPKVRTLLGTLSSFFWSVFWEVEFSVTDGVGGRGAFLANRFGRSWDTSLTFDRRTLDSPLGAERCVSFWVVEWSGWSDWTVNDDRLDSFLSASFQGSFDDVDDGDVFPNWFGFSPEEELSSRVSSSISFRCWISWFWCSASSWDMVRSSSRTLAPESGSRGKGEEEYWLWFGDDGSGVGVITVRRWASSIALRKFWEDLKDSLLIDFPIWDLYLDSKWLSQN